MPRKKSKNYLDNDEFLEEINKSKAQDKLTNKCVEMFQLIIDHASTVFFYKPGFEDDKLDCQQTAMLDMLKAWKSFDKNNEGRTNAFAYFTTVAYMGMCKGWNQLHKKDPLDPNNGYVKMLSINSTSSSSDDGSIYTL